MRGLLSYFRKDLGAEDRPKVADKIALVGNPVEVYNSNEQINPARLPRYLARRDRLMLAIEEEEAKEFPNEAVLGAYRLEVMELNRKVGC
jgi:hypothetical protein